MICPICLHDYPDGDLQKHHLIPKSRGGTEKNRLCCHCHRQIHALYSEKELELYFNTLDLFLSSSRLRKWIKWIRKRRPESKLKTKDSKSRKKKRKR